MNGSSTASEILGRIENDAVFSGFLEAGFDPASFASKIVRADVGRAAAGGAAGAAAVGATPVLQLQQGGDGLGSSSNGGGAAASAESVSSQAEITLDVRTSLLKYTTLTSVVLLVHMRLPRMAMVWY